jgi:hypothetical protein
MPCCLYPIIGFGVVVLALLILVVIAINLFFLIKFPIFVAIVFGVVVVLGGIGGLVVHWMRHLDAEQK